MFKIIIYYKYEFCCRFLIFVTVTYFVTSTYSSSPKLALVDTDGKSEDVSSTPLLSVVSAFQQLDVLKLEADMHPTPQCVSALPQKPNLLQQGVSIDEHSFPETKHWLHKNPLMNKQNTTKKSIIIDIN